jgi:hypothetical protein
MHGDADTRPIVEYLLFERRQLLSSGAEEGTLEANRLALAYWQGRRSSTETQQPRSGRSGKAKRLGALG